MKFRKLIIGSNFKLYQKSSEKNSQKLEFFINTLHFRTLIRYVYWPIRAKYVEENDSIFRLCLKFDVNVWPEALSNLALNLDKSEG